MVLVVGIGSTILHVEVEKFSIIIYLLSFPLLKFIIVVIVSLWKWLFIWRV